MPPSLTIGAVQAPLRPNDNSPLESTKHVIHLMKEVASKHEKTKHKQIDLFVLPELCPLGYSDHSFDKFLPLDEDAIKMMEEVNELFSAFAKEINCYICYGTIGTKIDGNINSRGSTIRQNVIDNTGKLICYYDKIHLCNYGDCAETRFFVAGNRTCSFQCRGFQIGIIICADMRNPSLSRELASKAHKCDIILQPAAFSRDKSFRTWKSFRETRAVENSVYFVAVNYAGEYYGNTSVVEPWVDENHEPEVMGIDEGVLVKEIRRDVLSKVRREFPYHQQLMSEEQPTNIET